MKIVRNGRGLFVRLGTVAAMLLLGQQALAQGTDAGVTVSNQATVAYVVGGNTQTPIESDPNGNSVPGAGLPTDFLVDRRVDFTLVANDAVHTQVAPDDVQAIASFTLTNLGNAIMDWQLTIDDLTSLDPDVRGLPDTDDVLINYQTRVANGDGPTGVPDFGTDLPFVDELGEGLSVVIFVYADAPLTLANDSVDNFTLNATAADAADALPTGGALDALLTEAAGVDDPTVIDSVFANLSGADGAGNATEGVDDGYQVVSAALVITKEADVISAPFGSNRPIPGAVVEYTITIDNSSGDDAADGVVITDLIDSDVTFVADAYEVVVGDGQNVSFDSGASFCVADLADANGDGCSIDAGGNLSVAGPALTPISVAAGASLTVQFQVLIPTL